jgi:hypothetical protein
MLTTRLLGISLSYSVITKQPCRMLNVKNSKENTQHISGDIYEGNK